MAVFSRFSSSPITPTDTRRRQRGIQALAQERINPEGGAEPTDPRARAFGALKREGAPSLAEQAAGVTGTKGATMTADQAYAAPVARPTTADQVYQPPPPPVSSARTADQAYVPPPPAAPAPDYASLPGGHDALERGVGATPAAPSTNPFDLANVRAQQAAELEAMRTDYDHATAKAQADAEARGGLGGFGLSGATSALVRDAGLAGANSRAKGLAALQKEQRGELRDTSIDFANLRDLADNGVDLSAIDPSLAPSEDALADESRDELLTSNAGVDATAVNGGLDEANTAPGSRERPYEVDAREVAKIVALNGPLKLALYTAPFGVKPTIEYEDANGRRYYFGPNGLPNGTPGVHN